MESSETFSITPPLPGRQIRAMTRVIDDPLDASPAGLGHIDLLRADVAVSVLIERTLETAGPVVAARGHELAMSFPMEQIFINADAMWLARALHNVLANAARSTEPGGRIRITVQRDAESVALAITDTGAGIPPDQLDTIFELHVRAEQAGEGPTRDVGTGLYLARRLVEAHGGAIRATSDGRGRGSEFIVCLPCKRHGP